MPESSVYDTPKKVQIYWNVLQKMFMQQKKISVWLWFTLWPKHWRGAHSPPLSHPHAEELEEEDKGEEEMCF